MTNNVFTQSEESLWKRMPSNLKSLLLTNEEVKLDKLLSFYNTSNFRNVSTKKYTPKYSFVLANYYVHQLNNVQAAMNLIFNANFLLYLNKSQHATIGAAIDYFLDRAQFVHATHLSSAVKSLESTSWKEIDSEDMLYELTALNEFPELYTAYQITANCNSSKKKGDEQRLNKLREYTTKAIENDYNQLVSKRDEVVDHLMGNDWWKDKNNDKNGKKKKKSSGTSSMKESAPQEDNEEIVIKFVDEQSQQQEVSIKLSKSTQLKIPFNQYAEGRRLSLRSFRFVYGGSTLFLSSVGKQTPIDLGMKDGDVITVVNLEAGKEEKEKPVVSKVVSKQKKKSPKKRTKGKQKKKRVQPLVIQQTEVELKVEHSKKLGRVHEQAESQFKLIRQHLNNLVLERSKPKSKKKKKKVKEPLQSISQPVNYTPSSIGLGGKAGKTHYTIQVGEVSNLYKTSKRRRSSRSPPTNQLKIDLHGLTRQESIKSLDDSLPIWQERAMSGSYPFVVPVEIVCGGGSQVLSEVVEQWIRNNDQVANAPQTRCC